MTMINNQMAFSAVIESERVKAGLTQDELASNAGISIRNLKMIENGEANPSLETMLALCEALKIAISANKNDDRNARNMLTYSDSMNPSEYGIMHYIQRSTDMLNKSILPFTVVTGSNKTNGSYLNHIVTALHDNDDYNVITIGNHDMINDIIDINLNSVLYINHYVMGSDNKPLQYVFNTDEFMNLIHDTMSDDELTYLHMNNIKLVLDSMNDGNGFTYDDLNKYQSDNDALNDELEFIRVVLRQKLLSGLYRAGNIDLVLDYDYEINLLRGSSNLPMNETIIPSFIEAYGSDGKYDKKRYMISSCNEFIRIFKYITSNENMESEHPIINPAKTNILIINASADVRKMQSFQSYLLNAIRLCRSYRIIPILNVGNDAGILSNNKIKARTTDVVFTHEDYINNAIHNYKNVSGMKSMEMAGFLTRMPLDEYVHYDMIANKLEPFILN